MPELTWENLTLTLPPGWEDYAPESDEGPQPLTLARVKDEKGVLQISLAEDLETPNPDDLANLIKEFAAAHQLRAPTDFTRDPGPPTLAAATVHTNADFIRIWYLSTNHQTLLATYIAEPEGHEAELAQADQIIRSIRLNPEP